MRLQEAMAALAAGTVVDATAIKVIAPTNIKVGSPPADPNTGPQRTVSLG